MKCRAHLRSVVHLRAVGTLLLALVLAPTLVLTQACGSVPTTHYYVLAPPSPGPAVESAATGIRLGVETFVVDPPYDQDRFVYRVGRESGEVGFYNHHRWAAPPGRLVATALAAGLGGTPGIAAVEPVSPSESYSHRLAGRVVALEEIDLTGRQLARIQVDLKLLDMDEGTVVRTRFVSVEADGQAEEVSDVMQLMQAAFSKLVAEVRAELEAVFQP